MRQSHNTHGGGAKTNANGLTFEQNTSLRDAFRKAGYTVDSDTLLNGGEEVGIFVEKYKLYKFLKAHGINWKDYMKKKVLPDEALIIESQKRVYVIEKKWQGGYGSVDEKLCACEFKKQQYEKLFTPIGYTVKMMYLMNDWFKQESYKDIIEYMESKDIQCFYEELPLSVFADEEE